MNAAPPVSQAQPLSDAVQPDAPASAASASTRAGRQDFAAALSDAGGKPARKSAATKHPDPALNGSSLPAPGNPPPPALASAPPAETESLAAAVPDSAAIVKGAQGSAQGSVPSAIAAASTAPIAPGIAGGATILLSSANLDPAAAPVPAAPPGLAPTSAIKVDATTPPPGNGPPHAASLRTLATPGTSTAAAAPKLAAGNARTAPSNDATAKQGTSTPTDSAPSSGNALNDSALSNGPAASGTGAAAQAAMAAAIAQGTSAPTPDTASSDDLAISDTGVPQGAAGSSDPAAAFAHAAAASISAAVTAAAAAPVQALSDAASAVDKRSHANSTDATLSSASNDGSVGAAQLLTSNTSTDSVPMPTFKVTGGVDTAQFGQGVADRVSLMMDGNLTSAKLQVNPPALGPIEVRIALQGGHAQVWLSSHSAVTRDALESSSSKLREMLGSQGFSQVSVDISQRSFQERSPQSQAYEAAPSFGSDVAVAAQASVSMPRSANGLLDAYA